MMKRLLPILALFLFVSPALSSGPNNSLCWNQVTTNMDGTVITDLAGYKVYTGKSSGIYTGVIDVRLTPTPSAPCVLLKTLSLSNGTVYVVATAYDTSGNESGPSNEVSVFFDGIVPAAPDGLIVK